MTAEIAQDEQLAGRLGRLLGARHPVAAIARATRSTATVACRGTSTNADFEIASLSKGMTSLLYAEALRLEEIRPDQTLGELLPIGDAPAGNVRLDALGTHRSGLPRLPGSARPWRRTFALWRYGTNPYGENLEHLLDQAREVRVGKPLRSPRARYSNFGFELLGHALAAAAGTNYPDLVRTRLADPLGMDDCYLPATRDHLRPIALTGRSKRGRARQPWIGEALGPAGGVRASIRDLAHLMVALLDGSAAGIAALDPVAPFGTGARIGVGWITITLRGRAITWHNGGSGGFRSWLGLDRAAGTGVAILSATSASIDRHGFALLAEHTSAQIGSEIG